MLFLQIVGHHEMRQIVEFAYYHLSKTLAHTSLDLLLTNWPFHWQHLDFQTAGPNSTKNNIKNILRFKDMNADVELGDESYCGFPQGFSFQNFLGEELKPPTWPVPLPPAPAQILIRS